jgi:hypothetical protein
VLVYFGGAVTLALGGLTVWSGIDTLQQKDVFDRTPSQNNLDVGRQRETRTNVLLAATAGVGLATAAVAILLVDWKGSGGSKEGGPSAQVGLGPGALLVQGSF